MIVTIEITSEELEQQLADAHCEIPIEQTSLWRKFEETISRRTFWGSLVVLQDDVPIAYGSFFDYKTHGYHYLCTRHAPIWLVEPTRDLEKKVLEALCSYVRARDRRMVFIRCMIKHDLPETRRVLSTVPYDQTVIVDLTGGDEAILARMKSRGRRYVRKALREAPISCGDETERAITCFDEYYAVLVDTCERDGFTPAPACMYQDMLRILGPKYCCLYAGRDEDGQLTNWSINTICGTTAVYYYGATASRALRMRVADRLMYYAMCDLGHRGCKRIDLMGIGSALAPELAGLNQFKTKFSEHGTVSVAPSRDLPLKSYTYAGLVAMKKISQLFCA